MTKKDQVDDLYSRWDKSEYIEINNFLSSQNRNWQNKRLVSDFNMDTTTSGKLDVRGFYFDVGLFHQYLEHIDFSYCNTKKAFEQSQKATGNYFDCNLRLGFSDSILENCCFGHAEIAGCVRCSIVSCCFDNAVINGSLGVTQAIDSCSFRHATFKNGFLSRIVFENCDFTGAIFSGSCDIEHCKFIDCRFDNAVFKTTILKKLAKVEHFLKCEFIRSPLSARQKKHLSETVSVDGK